MTDIKKEKMQISKLKCADLDAIIVYRTAQGNSLELIDHLEALITPGVTTSVCGDFNICLLTHRNKRVTRFLETNGFILLMNEVTHIKGGHIDHFYFKPGNNVFQNPSILRYSPYYSDHYTICVTIERITKNEEAHEN